MTGEGRKATMGTSVEERRKNGHQPYLTHQIGDLMLLKTPTAQLAVNGGSQHPGKRKAGGHGPTLADEVEHLLPTPRAQNGEDRNQNIWARDKSQPQNLENALAATLPGAITSPPSAGGNRLWEDVPLPLSS